MFRASQKGSSPMEGGSLTKPYPTAMKKYAENFLPRKKKRSGVGGARNRWGGEGEEKAWKEEAGLD